MRPILILIALALMPLITLAQDFMLTWKGDSLPCRFPERPGKEGLRPAGKYENGHIRLMAVFPGDSVRVIEAGDIRAYYRKKHGRGFLCNGFFEAKKIKPFRGKYANLFMVSGKDDWYFMQRLHKGSHASLYIVYFPGGRTNASAYFLSRADDHPHEATLLDSRKHALKLLDDPDVSAKMKKVKYRKSRKGFTDIVTAYNTFKQEAGLPN